MRLASRVLPAIAFFLVVLPTRAQTPQPATDSAAPTLHVYSRETIVDVLVTDDKNQPVRGLTRSDFTVEEDGHPQPIRGFSEYDKTTPPPPRTLPPNTYTNHNTLPTNGPVQIFLFDVVATPPAMMERAKKYIAAYLHSMPAGTQVAVFELSPSKGPLLLQGVTPDSHTAAAVVDNLDVEWIRPPKDWQYPIAIILAHQIADYVAAIHGRKNLIWITPGSPLPILHDGGYSWGIRDMTTIHRLMDLYDIFTREQMSIYPFDPGGVHKLGPESPASPDADSGAHPGWMESGSGNLGTLTGAVAFLTKSEIPLLEAAIADETGGATSNSNDFQTTIASIVDGTEHSYVLSYVPTRPDMDGHFHPIQIKVDRPGVHLSYRTGYNDEQPFPPDAVLMQGMTEFQGGPMRLGSIPATQILFDLQIEPSSPDLQTAALPSQTTPQLTAASHAKTAPYDTVFTVDTKQLALVESPDGTRTASIELDLGAFDFYHVLITARSQTFKITLTPAQVSAFFQKPLQLHLAIDLPPGPLTLRAGVFDTNANHAGTLEIPLTVSKTKN